MPAAPVCRYWYWAAPKLRFRQCAAWTACRRWHAEEENGKTRLEITLNAGADQKQQAAVSLALAAAGCAVLHMETESLSLEDVFLQLTEFDPPEEDPPESPEADEDGYEDDELEPDEEEGGPQP